MKNWLDEPQFFEEGSKKKLPDPTKKNILITSALPYVNNVPHLGNIIGSTLSADVFSRYCRMRGYQSLYVCGTDEYGTATEMKALQEGMTPQEICDKFHKLHKEIYEWFGIDFDYFGRTTTENQTEITQDIFLKVYKNGYTSTSSMEQLYCGKCDKFLADRYVLGTCPNCKFDDARGDQCDGCGKLIDAVELVNPKCHICKSVPRLKSSEHIFIDLDRLSNDVESHFNKKISSPNQHWSANAIAIVRGWLKTGLERRCITRDLRWGVPVPLKEFASKVFYVWFDAPVGYLSATKTLLGDDWVKWWKNSEQVELYHFLGKDNVAFHGVIFPAAQIAADDNYTMVSHMCATEYLNYEDQKFSKSRGVGVFGDAVAQTGIPADVWRFYLVYMRPESQDTVFSWDDFLLKVNSELISNLGNFINRGLKFTKNFFDDVQPDIHLTAADEEYIRSVNDVLTVYTEDLENVRLREALTKVLAVSRLGNQYMQANRPWELIKGTDKEKKRAGSVVGLITNTVVLLSAMLYPFMPAISAEIRRQCNISKCISLPTHFIRFLAPGHRFNEPTPLIAWIEPALIETFKKQFNNCSNQPAADGTAPNKKLASGAPKKQKSKDSEPADPVDHTIDVGRLDLRVGRILEAKKHPDADALYIETIDVGEEKPRTVVSGLVRHVPLEQMMDRLVICVCNLKPAKMRGVESQAMVLCASTPDKVEIMEVDPSCKPGDRLVCEPAFATRPDAVLNPKKKIWETVAVDLKVSHSGEATYKNKVLKVNGVHPIRAPTLRDVPVK